MRAGGAAPLVLVAAGGTGGHLFPAEALAAALRQHSVVVHLATDTRATRYGSAYPTETVHVIPSETVRSRHPLALARTAAILGRGVVAAWLVAGRLRPAAVVGFGGYPTIPPVLAATWRRIPTVIHDANAVMGRANRMLAPRVTAIATSFPGVLDRDPALAAKATLTGNPVRPAVIAAVRMPYSPVRGEGPLRIVVFGGSQGARVMADIVPGALAQVDPLLRLRFDVTQQAREEDLERVRAVYAGASIAAEVAPFFSDLPERIARAHLVISRSGASTVAELAAIGRPSILVPLPNALDQDQLANATVLEQAGGALLIRQDDFTPERVAREVTAFAADPVRLETMAQNAKSAGSSDAAERLAALVLKVAKIPA
jgi:UDP-N-acetylglucosamine--N-acetylmuramyl-(pentapeptide) pyrophosphoryl-undecaprenol N-acetylglucosamine transferase